MGVAMVCILLFHGPYLPGISNFFYRFGLWGVDLFLFVSGFGCSYAIKKSSVPKFILRRILRLYPTCLFIGIIISIADFYLKVEPSEIPGWMKVLSLQRWYIQAITVYYLLFPILYKTIKSYGFKSIICITIACIIMSQIGTNIYPFYTRWIIERFPVFSLGIYLAIYDFQINKLSIILSFIILMIAALSRCNFFSQQIWPFALAFSIPLLSLIICRFNVSTHTTIFLNRIGLYSLEIYLIHEYVLNITHRFGLNPFVEYLVLIILLIPLCLVTKRICNMVPKIG